MQDSTRLSELMGAAENSAGSSQEQFNKTLDSLEAKLNKLSDTWEEFLMGIANSDVIKGTVDALTGLLEIINKLTKGTGGLDSALMKLSLVGVAMQAGGNLFNSGLGYASDMRTFKSAQKAQAAGATAEQLWDKYSYVNGMAAPTLGGSIKEQFAGFSQRGVVGLFGGMIKGIKGLFTSTLTDELAKDLRRTTAKKAVKEVFANKSIPFDSRHEQAKQRVDDMRQYTALTGGFKNLASGFGLGKQSRQGLGDIANAQEALGKLQTASGGAATGMAKFGAVLGAMGPALIGVGVALGALVLAAHLVYVNSDEYKLKKINEQIEGLNNALDRTNKSIDELKAWKDNQNDLTHQLSELTRGTTEFNQALVEANQNVLTLLQQYDGLKLSSERGKYGELQIDEQSLENLIDKQVETASAITSALIDTTLNKQLIEAQGETRRASSKYFTTDKYRTSGVTVRLDQQYKAYSENNNGETFADYIATQFPQVNDQDDLLTAAVNYEQAILKEMQLQEQADEQHNAELVKDLNPASFFKDEIARKKITETEADSLGEAIVDNYFNENSKLNDTDWKTAVKAAGLEDQHIVANGKLKLPSSEEKLKQIYKKLFGSEDLSQFRNDDGTLDKDTLQDVITSEIERIYQKQALGQIMTGVGVAGSDSLVARMASGQLTQADINAFRANNDYSQFNGLKVAGQSDEDFKADIDRIVNESEATLANATERFVKFFGEEGAKDFEDLDSASADVLSHFAESVKTAADGADFDETWNAIFPSNSTMKQKTAIAKALNAADKGSVQSIKANVDALVESGIITQDVADKISATWIDLNNAIQKIDVEAVIGKLQSGNKFIRDINENQQRSFTDKEYESLKEILSVDGVDRSDWFTQTLDGDWIYLGASIETLTQAIYDNTSALLGQSREQLEASQLLQNKLNADKSLKDQITRGAGEENYNIKAGMLNGIKGRLANQGWNETLSKIGLNLNQDWSTLDFTNSRNREYVDDMYSKLFKIMDEDYQSQIDRIDVQNASWGVQSQNPWVSKEQAATYLQKRDYTNSQAYFEGMVALAGATDGVNQDIINEAITAWESFNGSFTDASDAQVEAYGNAVSAAFDEIARAQDRIHLDALKDDVDDLKDTLSDANFSAQASKVAQTLSTYLGIKVDGDFVEQYKDLIRTIVEEGDEGEAALKKVKEAAIALNGVTIDPIQIEAILNTDDANQAALDLANYLGQIVDKDYTLLIQGKSDMSDVLGSLSTIIMQLALLKATATTDSDQAVEIMTTAAEIINQIADAMGFEMDTEYSEKPLFADFANYRQEINGEPGAQTISWVKDGTSTSLQVGSQMAMSFKRKGDNSSYNFVGATTNSSPTLTAENNKWANRTTLPGGYKIEKSEEQIAADSNIQRRAALKDAFDRLKNLGIINETPITNNTGRGDTNHMNDKDTSNKSGSGSGDKNNNSSKAPDEWENAYDWLYNLTADINEELKKREKLEIKYDNILKDRNKTAKQLYENQKAQLESLEKSRELNAEAYASRLAELKLEAKAATTQYSNDDRFNMSWGTGLTSGSKPSNIINLGGSSSGDDSSASIPQGKRTMLSESELGRYATFNWDDNTIEINWDLINQITDKQKGEAVSDYISKLEEIQDKVDEAEKSLLEIDGQIRDIIEQGKDEYESFEQQVFDALVNRYQKEIDKLDEINQSISDANSKLIDEMENAIDKERQARDNQETEQDLTDKQKRLAYLQSDTSNANAMEILDLQKELREGQRDYTDDLIDQKIDELKEQNDKASEQRQTQIDLMTKNLEMAQETGLLWQEVYNLMDIGVDSEGALVKQSELFDLLQSEAGWQGMSAVSKMTWLDELTETVKAGMSYLMTGRQLEYIGMKAGQQINFTAYDENGKLQYLTGTVDTNGDVIDANGIRYSEIFQNYDGSFTTMERAGVGTKKETPKSESSSSGSSNNSSSSGRVTGNVSVWKIYNTGEGPKGTILNPDGSNSGLTINDPGQSPSYAMLRAMRDLTGDLSKYDDDGDGSLSTSELKKALRDQGINWNDEKYQMDYDKSWDPSYKRYASGGLNTKAGPAWLDGSFSKPELVLNANDTQNFLELRDLLRALQLNITNPHGNLIGNKQVNGDNYYEIDINVDSIANDYDVSQMADKIKKLITQDALYRNGNAINRLR